MSISSFFIAGTFILWGLVTVGVLDLDMQVVGILAIITGIVVLVEGSGVHNRFNRG